MNIAEVRQKILKRTENHLKNKLELITDISNTGYSDVEKSFLSKFLRNLQKIVEM